MALRIRKKWIVAAIIALVTAPPAVWAWYHHRYPYGRSHCCDKVLILALRQYAESHGGRFPAGGGSPEASLSLLYRDDPTGMPAEILRGKTVPVEAVEARLNAGKLLTPETCGWHYIEGLTTDDDPRLALFWDKAGLGHNGERLPDGGHVVWFVNCSKEYIPKAKWEAFLAEQTRLHAARIAKNKVGS